LRFDTAWTRTGHQAYADKADASAGHGRPLAKRNAANRILHKAKRNRPGRPTKTPKPPVAKRPQRRRARVRHP
jgi:hypothetical protein